MTTRDNPKGVERFKDAYHGGQALVVLGGESARTWESLRDDLDPDVIIGVNGVCFEIDDLDFHLVVENMHMAAGRAKRGEDRYRQMMKILSPSHHARVRMYSFLNWNPPVLIDDRIKNVVKIKRMGELGDDYKSQMERFNFREYGDGFLAGPLFDHPGALSSNRIKFRVGTVGTQAIHLAGVLGCAEVHTIGMDFCNLNHWYKYPKYQPDRFRTGAMFTEFAGLQTQHDWLQGARWLGTLEPLFERDGLQWVDHSHGLFDAMDLFCASTSTTASAER
jgi:hypothetical protein